MCPEIVQTRADIQSIISVAKVLRTQVNMVARMELDTQTTTGNDVHSAFTDEMVTSVIHSEEAKGNFFREPHFKGKSNTLDEHPSFLI